MRARLLLCFVPFFPFVFPLNSPPCKKSLSLSLSNSSQFVVPSPADRLIWFCTSCQPTHNINQARAAMANYSPIACRIARFHLRVLTLVTYNFLSSATKEQKNKRVCADQWEWVCVCVRARPCICVKGVVQCARAVTELSPALCCDVKDVCMCEWSTSHVSSCLSKWQTCLYRDIRTKILRDPTKKLRMYAQTSKVTPLRHTSACPTRFEWHVEHGFTPPFRTFQALWFLH